MPPHCRLFLKPQRLALSYRHYRRHVFIAEFTRVSHPKRAQNSLTACGND
jgi:hypothetical protein